MTCQKIALFASTCKLATARCIQKKKKRKVGLDGVRKATFLDLLIEMWIIYGIRDALYGMVHTALFII